MKLQMLQIPQNRRTVKSLYLQLLKISYSMLNPNFNWKCLTCVLRFFKETISARRTKNNKKHNPYVRHCKFLVKLFLETSSSQRPVSCISHESNYNVFSKYTKCIERRRPSFLPVPWKRLYTVFFPSRIINITKQLIIDVIFVLEAGAEDRGIFVSRKGWNVIHEKCNVTCNFPSIIAMGMLYRWGKFPKKKKEKETGSWNTGSS